MSPSFEDIDSKVEKAQGDKARFLESKKGLLPHFEFPEGEDKEEKHFSKETILADIMEEKLERAKEMMQNPVLLENAYQYLEDNATRGSIGENNTIDAYRAFLSLSALITTHSLSRLSPEKQNKINSYFKNQTLLENAYQDLQNDATRGSQKEVENAGDPYWALQTLSSLISTHTLPRLSPEKQNEVNSYIENPILLENTYRYFQNHVTQSSKEEGQNTGDASLAFQTLSSLISTHTLPRLSPEKQNEVNSYLENPILLENAYRELQNYATEGSKKEGGDINNASYAFRVLSPLITVKDYLRARGKKIDDEKFAKEALNPKKNIPLRPEGILKNTNY